MHICVERSCRQLLVGCGGAFFASVWEVNGSGVDTHLVLHSEAHCNVLRTVGKIKEARSVYGRKWISLGPC